MTRYRLAAFSALVVAIVSSALHARYAVHADTVARLAMWRLNADPGVLEVMGAPLAGKSLSHLLSTWSYLGIISRPKHVRQHHAFRVRYVIGYHHCHHPFGFELVL